MKNLYTFQILQNPIYNGKWHWDYWGEAVDESPISTHGDLAKYMKC